MACWTVVIFSASSSGISHSNSSSRAITSSTVSSESAPKSSTNEDSFLMSASLTPNCSATIFLTRCSMFSIYDSFPEIGCGENLAILPINRPQPDLNHVHAAIDMNRRAGDVGGLRAGQESHGVGDFLRLAEAAQRYLQQQGGPLLVGQGDRK